MILSDSGLVESIPAIWHDHPRLKPGQCPKVWNKCTRIPYSEYKLLSFFKIHVNFLKFQNEYFCKFNDFKGWKKSLYQTGRDAISYLTDTEKSIRNWHGINPAAKKDKIVDREANRRWTGLTRWKKVLNPPDPVRKGADPVWPGGKRCWSGVIFYAFRITEVGRMKWKFFCENF